MVSKEDIKQDNSIYERRASYFYIIPEYLLIGIILLTGPLITSNVVIILLEIIGIWYLFMVLWTNYISKFNLAYRPSSNKKRLVPSGPYKFIRHPYSTAVLFLTLILVINHISVFRIIAWFLLLVVLILRASYEEKIYHEYYNDYSLYKQRTYRLIPFIY